MTRPASGIAIDPGLAALGWRPVPLPDIANPGADEGALHLGRVISAHRSGWQVHDGRMVGAARAPGRVFLEDREDRPAVGDFVVLGGAEAIREIRAIVPRRGRLARKVAGEQVRPQVLAANVDVAWLVTAADADFNAGRLLRYAIVCEEGGVDVHVVLTKADRVGGARIDECTAWVGEMLPGRPVTVIANAAGPGLAELRAGLHAGSTVVLLGSSGVGKSTLVNALAGSTVMVTGDVRARDGKGRHTTTHRQLIALPDGSVVIDTPGMRELALWDSSERIAALFADVETLADQCRFRDCRHTVEPGCAIRAGLASGALATVRHAAWRSVRAELAELHQALELQRRRRPDR